MCKKINSKDELMNLYENVKDLVELRKTEIEEPSDFEEIKEKKKIRKISL